MKKVISTALALSIFCSAVSVRAEGLVAPPVSTVFQQQQAKVDEDPGKVTPLKRGQISPYAGVLFSPKAAAIVATEIKTAKDKTKIEIDSAVATAEAKKDLKYNDFVSQCNTDKKVLDASSSELKNKIVLLESDLKKANESAPSRTFWAGVGFTGGVILTLLTVFVVVRITN